MAQAEYAEEAKLIRLVENFPAIYDVNHIDNKNPIAISSMWEIISKKIKLPTEDCYAKWKYLRRRFTSCSVSSLWPHYEAMQFLEAYITRRKKKHGADAEEETSTVADLPPPSKKRKRETNETEESIKLFCQSISGDLLQLSAEKQMEVRIKIMILIQKYLSNSDQSDESGDTLVAKIMETFSQVEKMIVRQKMKSADWLFIYCIKNVFSKMMSLRPYNKELQNALHEFEVVEKYYEDEDIDINPLTVNKKELLPREKKTAFKKPAKEVRKDNQLSDEDVIIIEDQPIIKKEPAEKSGKIVKEERKCTARSESEDVLSIKTEKEPAVTKSALQKPSTSANIRERKSTAHHSEHVVLVGDRPAAKIKKEPVYPTEAAFEIPAKTSADNYEKVNNRIIRPPDTIASMMKQILSNGIEKKFCNICDIKIEDNSHINTDAHIAASKKWHLPYAVYILDPAILKLEEKGPTCIPCQRTFDNWWYLKDHMFRSKEKHNSYCSNQRARNRPNPEYALLLKSIRKGCLTVGTFSYCFACCRRNESSSHNNGKEHLENMNRIKAFCRFHNEVYCFCCDQLFDVLKLVKHMNKADHNSNFEKYFARNYSRALKIQF